MPSLVFHNLFFSYDASITGIFTDASFGVSEGWTGIIGANGSGKTTLLRLACGELEPREGSVTRPSASLYCPQRTDEPMAEFSDFLSTSDAEAWRLRGRLGIEDDWLDRWHTLSHGERKRAQIATCLWLAPDLLAVDEPTNHLDRAAREMVYRALRSYRGVGLLVSHDRELLDDLCGHCVFVSAQVVALRSGGYTTATEAVLEEDRVLREKRAKARANARRLEKELAVRREQQRKSDRGRSKRGIARRDHDAKSRIDQARVTDSGAGKRLRQLEGRIQHAHNAGRSGGELKRLAMGISIHGEVSQRNALFRLPAGSIPLGKTRWLHFPDLMMAPRDRIALVGPNGCGKSTLVRHLLAQCDLEPQQLVSIPQEIDASLSAETLDRVRRLPQDALGRTMAWVSRLGSDPVRLLDSQVPSPGEVRKLLLAMSIDRGPHLIVLDEPTNHMDLPSIECVESALRDCACGLLLVSHDERFLRELTTVRWEISPDDPHKDSNCQLALRLTPDENPPLTGDV